MGAIYNDRQVIGVVSVDATGTVTARQVQGMAATGAVVSGNPVYVGGNKGGNVAPLSLNANTGYLNITTGSASLFSSSFGATYVISAYGDNGGSGALITAPMVWDGSGLQATPGNTTGAFTIPKPTTSGGVSIARLIAATNGVIKASAGQLYTATLTNTNAALRYLQIYNKATAGTLSTDTPAMTIPLPPNASVMIDFSGMGGQFTTGISWQFTTDDIAIPTTAGAATDIHGFVTYK